MLTTILVIMFSIAVITGIGVATWSIITTRRREREASHDQDLREFRKDGKNAGMAIAAATIDHLLENGTDLADITHRVSTITSRWAEYDTDAYQGQWGSLNMLREENRESGDR